MRTDAEKQYPDIVVPRKQSVGGGPSRDTAFRSHPQGSREKELPVLPRDAQQYPVQDHDIDRLDLEDMEEKPVRRPSKLERLTGSTNPRAVPANNVRTERVMVSQCYPVVCDNQGGSMLRWNWGEPVKGNRSRPPGFRLLFP